MSEITKSTIASLSRAFFLATVSASTEMSASVIFDGKPSWSRYFFTLMPTQPEPVQRSRMRRIFSGRTRVISARNSSTRVSVSWRGISTLRSTKKSQFMKPQLPMMYWSGSWWLRRSISMRNSWRSSAGACSSRCRMKCAASMPYTRSNSTPVHSLASSMPAFWSIFSPFVHTS